MLHLWLLCASILLDRILGDPPVLWSRIPHPVVLFGAVIDQADKVLNREGVSTSGLRRRGWWFIVLDLITTELIGLFFSGLLRALGPLGWCVEILLVAVFIAHKSLDDHARAVMDALERDGLKAGRQAVSMIVGRDTSRLDESGVSKAAIESVAENFSDGVVAPVFWYAVAGLPGLFAYKFLNTADSMIGHKTHRHIHFGRGAALLDDVANYVPARLSALICVMAAWFAGRIHPTRFGADAWRRGALAALSDSGLHRSPNAGWPEAVFAGVLNLQLGGTRSYGDEGKIAAASLFSAGRPLATRTDIGGALILLSISGWVLLLSVIALLVMT